MTGCVFAVYLVIYFHLFNWSSTVELTLNWPRVCVCYSFFCNHRRKTHLKEICNYKEMMIFNLTLLTKPPRWWCSLSGYLWAVRDPVSESRLIYNVKCEKKNPQELSIIQIRWAGKDHRRLQCLHCVSLSVEGRNGKGKTEDAFCFISWGTFLKLLPHSFRNAHRLRHLRLPTSVCVMRKCNVWKVSLNVCMGLAECSGRWGCRGGL